MKHLSDVFELKLHFVAYPSGLISVLIHIPVETKRFKLCKYISIPIPTAKNYQFLVENDKSYLAINSEATLLTSFDDLSECLQMRDIYVCNHLTILHKSDTGKDCLFHLYDNQFAFVGKSCNYRIKPSSEMAVRLSDREIFVYSPNTATLASKCPGLESKLYNKGAAILSLDSRCVVTTTDYVFKRNMQIIEYEERSVLVDTPISKPTWEWISETQDAELGAFLETMANENSDGMKVIDIKKKKLFPKITASTANSPANNDTITIIVLLSYLSERYPTRY